jgi:capsular polysaccharide transport system permease protein
MSNNPRNQQPTAPFTEEPAIDHAAPAHSDFTNGQDAAAGEQPMDAVANAADAAQEATDEAAASAVEAGEPGGPNEARRLMVVSGDKPQAQPPLTPAARQAQRQAWLAQRAARAAAAARKNAPVPVKPAPAKVPAPLESWPSLAQPEKMLSAVRKARRRKFFTRLALFVGLPTLLTALYVFAWASPRYVSEFEITYQTYQNTQSLSAGLIQTVLGGSSSTIDPGSILLEYVRSDALLHKLDQKLNLRKYYSSDKVDYPARMRAGISDEGFLRYYRNHVVDASEGLGGYLTVDVQAFDPEFAHALAQAIVQACDQMVDEMTARARADGMKFAEGEVARQEDRVRQAQIAETKFQNEHHDLNPTNTANQYGQIVGNLESQLSQTRTALSNALSYARQDAPQVLQLKNQIAALESQLQDQRARLTGGNSTYSQILEEYARLQLEEQFAQNAYQSAQQGLAVARADAARKQSYLVDFVTPNLPDGPTQMFYITYLAAAFLGSLFLYAIGNLMVSAFRDQAGL